MKEKDTTKLERIDDELFTPLDPGEEAWMIGGSKTITGGVTYSPSGPDAWADMDFGELKS